MRWRDIQSEGSKEEDTLSWDGALADARATEFRLGSVQ